MADTPVVVTWNVANWVTVVVMALLGFMVLSLVINLVMRRKSAKSEA